VIEETLDRHISAWLDRERWRRRDREIEAARVAVRRADSAGLHWRKRTEYNAVDMQIAQRAR
jgi:hypothetical protein